MSWGVTLGEIEARLAREGVLEDARLPAADAGRAVRDLTADSREVRPGSLFCAWRGTARDSHAYLAEAASGGAVAAVVERPEPALDLPQLVVGDGRRGAALAAAAFFRDPWEEMTVVGVTGTNGKTTSAVMIRHLLALEGSAGYVGTLGMMGPDGVVLPGSEGLTTAGPVDSARWLRAFRDAGVTGVAMEVSSHALDQGRVAAVRFDAAVFTNLTRDHLDYHGTAEAYRAAKLRLLELLKPSGTAVVNADDAGWAGVLAEERRTLRFGMSPEAEIRAVDPRPTPRGMAFRLRTPEGEAAVALPLLGAFNVSNALAGAAVLHARGWPAARIAGALETLPQVRGRLERVEGPAGSPTVLLDYAHTPDALERALQAVRPQARGRLLVVFGAGGDRDAGKRPEMGRVAAENADLAFVTSDNPRNEDPERIIDEVERGMGRAPRVRLSDRRAAIRAALSAARSDDTVLLAGKGHECYQIVGTERRPFDERAIVLQILDELTAPMGGER